MWWDFVISLYLLDLRASLVAQMVENVPAVEETWVWSPGLGRSPEEGNGYPLQYSCLENSMDRGAWQATIHGVAKSQTQLSSLILSLHFSLDLKCLKYFRILVSITW